MDWAEKQEQVITQSAESGLRSVLEGYDPEQISGILFSAVQETVSDRLRMTKPQLAGPGRGFERWRILVREFEAPEQPVVQRGHQKRWSYPARCKSSAELQAMLPPRETWGCELETANGVCAGRGCKDLQPRSADP